LQKLDGEMPDPYQMSLMCEKIFLYKGGVALETKVFGKRPCEDFA